MTSFTDSIGRKWSLEIDYMAIKRVRLELEIDLLSIADKAEPGEDNLLTRLANDEILLVDVISVLLTPQIKERALTAEEFAKGLLGDALDSAVNALIEGIANFSRPQKGTVIRKSWAKIAACQNLAATKIVKMIDSEQMDQYLETEIDNRLATSMPSFGSTQESSE